MTIVVRRAHLDDRPAIEQFILLAYDDLATFKGPDRWRWQFVDNPYAQTENGLVPVWIALDGDQVVGQIAVQATNVSIIGQIHSAGWIVDVMILPAYRGLGLGHKLHTAVAQDVSLLLTLTMAPATRRMAERSGAVTLGPTWQYSYWTHLRADDVRRYLVQRTAHRPRIAAAVRVLCNGFAAHHAFASTANLLLKIRERNRKHRSHGLNVVEARSFGPEFDVLWKEFSATCKAVCPRDRKFLTWRFAACPDLKYQTFLAVRQDKVVGYSILRRTLPQELRHGCIVDMLANPDDHEVYKCLIDHAIGFFGRDVASVECATSSPTLAGTLIKAGFIKSRTLAPTVVTSDPSLRTLIESLRNDWFFSKADHDWDQVHLG